MLGNVEMQIKFPVHHRVRVDLEEIQMMMRRRPQADLGRDLWHNPPTRGQVHNTLSCEWGEEFEKASLYILRQKANNTHVVLCTLYESLPH